MRFISTLAMAAALIGASTLPLAAQGAASAQRRAVTGQVTAINHFTGKVTIRTQEIPGLEGKSMTVAYTPKDSAALAALHEGDHVKGDLVVKGSDTHMENVVATGTTRSDTAKRTGS